MRGAIAIALLMLASGCASPALRISVKLTEYGVPEARARCMGDRLEQRLSVAQLRRLGGLAALNRDRMGRMTVNDIVRTLDRPGDEAIVAEVLRAGLGCLI